MSLLYKTISSFFPTEEHCAYFVGEPWFLANYKLQMDVLRLCQEGYANVLFTPAYDRYDFIQHVMCCTSRYIDDDYHLDSRVYYEHLVECIVSSIPYGEYLLGRSWFRNSPYRHVDVFLIVLNGCANMINVVSGSFDEHIQSIMIRIEFCYQNFGNRARSAISAGECDGLLCINRFSPSNIYNEDPYAIYREDPCNMYGEEAADYYEARNSYNNEVHYEDYDGDANNDDEANNDNYDEDDDYANNYTNDDYDDYYDNDNDNDNEEADVADVADVEPIVAYLIHENGQKDALDKAALQDFLQTNTEEVQIIPIHETDANDDDDDDEADTYYGANIELGQNDVFDNNANVAAEPERISDEHIQLCIQYQELMHYTLLSHRQEVLLRMVANHLIPRDELDAIDKTILNSQTILDNWRAMLH
jgi:hypothetical protein